MQPLQLQKMTMKHSQMEERMQKVSPSSMFRDERPSLTDRALEVTPEQLGESCHEQQTSEYLLMQSD
jgi:hypothetical protein